MNILLLISYLIGFAYVLLIIIWTIGWYCQRRFRVPPGFCPSTPVSVLIPARNEAENIAACIRSVLACRYPRHLLEIIVVDDHSTDATFQIAATFQEENVRCIRLSDYLPKHQPVNAYKKKAIETGASLASGTLLVTTDADCSVPEAWLECMAAAYERDQPVMIAGPVVFRREKKFVQAFQALDFLSMQGITASVHALRIGNMCNGANLGFTREAFLQVDGYSDVDHLASGDDYLLMMKMQRSFPGKIIYLKTPEAIVTTAAQPDWRSFMQQRIRWASKSGKYDDHKITAMLAVTYLFNLVLCMLTLLGIGLGESAYLCAAILLFSGKLFCEGIYLIPITAFFKRQRLLLLFPLMQPLHILYVISAGLLGLAGVYQWKGRMVR